MQFGRGPRPCLVGVQKEEGNHEREQAGGFGEGEAKDGVREELTWNWALISNRGILTLMPQGLSASSQLERNGRLLTSEGRVASDTVDERAEDGADTNTSTGETDGSGTGTVDLGSSDDGGGSGLDHDAAGLHHAAHHVGGEVVASAIEEQAVADSGLLAYRADDGAWDGS